MSQTLVLCSSAHSSESGQASGRLETSAEEGQQARGALRDLNSHTSVAVTWSDWEPANTAAAALSHAICKHTCPVCSRFFCKRRKQHD